MLPAFGVRRPAGVETSGLFHCPGCGGDRLFRFRQLRAWLRLRRVPVVPLRRNAPSVECLSCAGRFSPGVLDVPTSARLEEVLWRGTRTAAAYVLTGRLANGDRWSADQARRALAVLRRVLGPDYGLDLLAVDLAAHREGSDLEVLRDLATHISLLGRESVLRGLADLVLVLDRSGAPDWSRLGVVAAGLDVPPAHVRAVVDQASARAHE